MSLTLPWHEQDAFWEMVGPILFHEQRLADAAADVDHLVNLLALKPGARVLDLGCGVGRHALELARRGYIVTGVDRTRAYLEQAVAFAADEGLRVEWVQADMRTFVRPASFDAAINLFTTFGYFDDPEEDRVVLDNLHRSLRPAGGLCLDVMGKEVLAARFRERDWYERDGRIVLEERRISQHWGWVDNRWIILDGANRVEVSLGHRLYSAVELAAVARSRGFSRIGVYGDLSGRPYDHTARRLVVVGQA